MRQTSDVHERVLAELFASAGVEADYAALDEERKVELLLAELAQPRLLYSPYTDYSDETNSELAILRAAQRDPQPLRRARDPQLHHLAHRDRVRPAGSAAAAKGNRPAAPRRAASST